MPAPCASGSSWLSQHVTDPPDRVDVARLVALLGLATEVADVDGERVGAGVEVVPPHPLEDQVAGQHLARVPEEQLEEIEFDPGQRELAGASACLARAEVELEVAETEDLALFARAPSQQCAQTSEPLGQGARP